MTHSLPDEKEKEKEYTSPDGFLGKKFFDLLIFLMDRLRWFFEKFIFTPYPHLREWGAKFFYFTSPLTNFFFFNGVGVIILYSSFLSILVFNILLFDKAVHETLESGWTTFFQNFSTSIHPSFYYFASFIVFLFIISIINTSLVDIPEVKGEIRRLYGELIIKERGYNAPTKTISVAVEVGRNMSKVMGYAVGGVVVTEVVKEVVYAINYDTYKRESVTNPLLQPPEKTTSIYDAIVKISGSFAASGVKD